LLYTQATRLPPNAGDGFGIPRRQFLQRLDDLRKLRAPALRRAFFLSIDNRLMVGIPFEMANLSRLISKRISYSEKNSSYLISVFPVVEAALEAKKGFAHAMPGDPVIFLLTLQ
jgi:hypothetical protein